MTKRNPLRGAIAAAALSTMLLSSNVRGDEPPAVPVATQSALRAVSARPGGLTASAAARRALAHSPDLAAKRAELAAATAAVDRALFSYLPRLELSASARRVSAEDSALGSMVTAPNQPAGPLPAGAALVNAPLEVETIRNQYAFEASLTVPISDYAFRIARNHAAAKHSERSARLLADAQAQRVAATARIAYYDLARARSQAIVSRQALALAEASLADAQARFDAGALPRADVARLQAQVASSRALVDRSDGLASVAEERLRILMNDGTGARQEIGEDLVSAAEVPAPRPKADLIAEALRRRPEVRALDESASALDEQAGVARAGMLPRLDAFGSLLDGRPNRNSFPQRDEFSTSWAIGLAATWTPTDLPGAAASGRELDARARAARAERQALVDSIRTEVTSARQDLLDARASIRVSAERLAAAEESHRSRRVLFQAGRATTVELTDAETELTKARLEVVHAHIDARIASVRLDRAIGRDSR